MANVEGLKKSLQKLMDGLAVLGSNLPDHGENEEAERGKKDARGLIRTSRAEAKEATDG